ncbi:MAG TPA: carboxylesterase family protein [Bacteroidales bacterium]|nr:carboxylesterase family protein [Bacteroidales bacterium]
MKIIYIVLAVSALIITSFSGADKGISSKIKVDGGTVEGYVAEGVTIFKGIPFAAPPTGDLRWKAPQPVVPWTGIRKCIANPPSAMQAKPVPFMMWSKEFMAPEEPLGEDCLYLNIWTAARKAGSALPVIVWIHGGGFTGGSGTVPLYDGTEMAKKGVVFVTINYRLGVFGFLAHPSLTAESQDKVSGNYGILDQIAALRWVRNNIALFGGDPGNVTIDGQSAGSFSVNALMISPMAKGLFHRAIGESGGMFSKSMALSMDLKSAEDAGVAFADKAGAKSISELRQKSAGDLIKLQGRWSIVVDNVVIPPSRETFIAGKQNDVPLITGWNADDGFSFGPPLNADNFRKNAVKTYGDRAEEFLMIFPSRTEDEAKQSQKIISQMFFGYENFKWASLQSSRGKNKSWLYYFRRVPPGEPNYGAFHSAEFGYVLKTLKLWNRPFTSWDYELSDIMSSYWVNFAKTGNPNGKGLPEWPSFDDSNPQVIDFGEQVKAAPVPYLKQLQFLDYPKY